MRAIGWRADSQKSNVLYSSRIAIARLDYDFSVTMEDSASYYDTGGRPILGDAVTTSDYMIRIWNKRAAGNLWDGSTPANVWYVSRNPRDTESGWTTTSLAANMKLHCRPGLLKSPLRIYYISTSGYLSYIESTDQGATWSSEVTVTSVSGEYIAVHPVSTLVQYVVKYDSPVLTIERYYNNSLSDTKRYITDLNNFDVHWSDAVSLNEEIIAFQLESHRAVTVKYNGRFSEPIDMMPGFTDYTFQRCRVCSVTAWNNTLWAVLERGIESSGGYVYQPWYSLATSKDGDHWSDRAIGVHECRGNFLVGSSHVYVADIGTIYCSERGIEDGGGEEIEFYAGRQAVSYGPSGRASEGRTTGYGQAQKGFVLKRYFSIGTNEALLSSEKIEEITEQATFNKDFISITSRGPIAMLAAYTNPVDEQFPMGAMRHYDFETPIPVLSGTWATETWQNKTWMSCSAEGLAVTSTKESFGPFQVVARLRTYYNTQPDPKMEAYIAFWVQDKDSYWLAGNNGESWIIKEVKNGISTTKATLSGAMGNQPEIWMLKFDGYTISLYRGSHVTIPEFSSPVISYSYLETYTQGSGRFGIYGVPSGELKVRFDWFTYGMLEHGWSQEEVIKHACARAGVSVDIEKEWVAQNVTSLQVSDTQVRYVDITANYDSGDMAIYTGMTGTDNYSALKTKITSSTVEFYWVSNEAPTLLGKYPCIAGSSVRIMIQPDYKGGAWGRVWIDGEAICVHHFSYPADRGYVGVENTPYVAVSMLGEASGYVWDRGTSARDFIVNTIKGTTVHIIEDTGLGVIIQKSGGVLGSYE
ncbi:MAG: hypothetical protein DSY80_02575 [Desulfocapsa sp.]|nr:MAG: hypothetical protein DSY80_02575 [Desulfocapsa sp.]